MGAWVRGDDVVAMTSYGEGTGNQGEIHEAMNFAGVHKLPVIFVCENNGYAISVPLDKQVGGGRWRPGRRATASPACWSTAPTRWPATPPPRRRTTAPGAVKGPTLIEARVVRLTSHSSDDDQRRYRDPAEVEALKEQDPIALFASQLRERGPAHRRAGRAAARRGQGRRSTRPAARAEARPDPDVATAELHVYADGTGRSLTWPS